MKMKPFFVAALVAIATCVQAQDNENEWLLQNDVDGSQSLSTDAQPATSSDAQAASAQGAEPGAETADSGMLAEQSEPQPETDPVSPSSAELATIDVVSLNPEKVQGEPSPASPRRIEEIVVTATKRESSTRDIPISIDALKGEDLVEKGATNLDEILKNSPGVNMSGSKVSVRGVALSSQQSLGSGEETGRFLGDVSMNAPSTRGGLGDFDPYDMRTVEILKGPQSSLFGGTALAGAIRFVPNPPELDGFAASVRTGYGAIAYADDPLWDVSAMANIPVGGALALRVAGTFRRKPNVIDDKFGGRQDNDPYDLTQIRYMARWDATDRLSFNITYLDYAFDGHFSFTDNPHRRETNLKRMSEPWETSVKVGSVDIRYAFDSFSIIAIANDLENGLFFDLDAAPVLGVSETLGAVPLTIDTEAKVPSYELRLVSDSPSESGWSLLADWDYLVGVYYMKAEQDVSQVITLGGLPATSTRSDVDVSEKAVFVNLTRHLFDDRLVWNMGARFAKTTLDVDTVTAPAPREFRSSQPDERVNPNFALTWNITDHISIRGSFAEGFRFGGGNSATTTGIEGVLPR